MCLVQLFERNPNSVEAWEERVDNLQALEAHEEALIVLDNAFEHVPPTSITGVQTICQPIRTKNGWRSSETSGSSSWRIMKACSSTDSPCPLTTSYKSRYTRTKP